MTTTTPDPVSNNTERVLVRNTVTGFEQGIAATAGLFTAGPLGALASWATIRGVQGKWTPWFILGVPSAVVLNVIQLAVLGALVESGQPSRDYSPQQTSSVQQENLYSSPQSSLPSYNVSNTGGTTLVSKCRQLKQAQSNSEFGEVFNISYSIGAEHSVPFHTTPQQDCSTVGVYVD